jgi:hypothetical protein
MSENVKGRAGIGVNAGIELEWVLVYRRILKTGTPQYGGSSSHHNPERKNYPAASKNE